MRGDSLTWHWDVPSAHPFVEDIRYGWDAGFGADARPAKLESDVAVSAYEAGVRARAELHDEKRHFTDLRVYLRDDRRVAYELTTRGSD